MARSREAPERIADETTLLQFRYFAAAAETISTSTHLPSLLARFRTKYPDRA
ncbi:hypothetical protein KB879_19735 [Cupriavidus sp. KK10]|uniref:hypothetical protein n=1 Tax=Cupriavidus sp. KK10 TaxID=1478019 RepID=UPI001BA7E29A|nr:hypothetical protein [Cupriavidus sp. KK10]QUN26371.1 hypothetical protein KB879_19735 [Cupriavidus sp. KK10]